MPRSERPCECVQCCDGDHAGSCIGCGGWGHVDGVPCEACDGTGVCPVCGGANAPEEEP